MKNLVGVPARDGNFFPRHRELAAVSECLHNGDHILIDSPRREGKTSFVLFLKDQQYNGNIYAYLDTEAIDNETCFFKKLYKELCCVAGKYSHGKHLKAKGQKFLQRIKSIHFRSLKLELADKVIQSDHKEDVFNLLSSIDLPNGKQLIIIVDEFPQTLQNIILSNKANLEVARKFLQSNRELRTHPSISFKVKFIITGSIGLSHIVAGIGCSSLIVDLVPIKFGQLTTEEAQEFLQRLLSTRQLTISLESSDHLLNKIEWLSPYHIQLMVQQLIMTAVKTGTHTISIDMIDVAFHCVSHDRSNSYLKHYHNRLHGLFKGADLKYVLEVLGGIARRGRLSKNTVLRLSTRYKTQMPWHALLHILMYDGYVHHTADNNAYRFNSPIVREWWRQFICK